MRDKLKPVIWLGDSRKRTQNLPKPVRTLVGVELSFVQYGRSPKDWKPMPSVGPGANEIRIHGENEYRVLYVARFPEAIHVLHVFMKKTQKTSQADIEMAQRRYRELQAKRKDENS